LHDIHFWKSELEREINDILGETDLLLAQKKRLDHALLATEVPMHIATDNLNCRQRRQGIDLVQDEVELSLLKVNNLYDPNHAINKELSNTLHRFTVLYVCTL